MKGMTISFIQVISVISVALIVGTFITVNVTLSQNQIQQEEAQDEIINITSSSQQMLSKQDVLSNKITELEGQVTGLNTEIATLKQEIVELKEQLIESKVIIAEQRKNITATN
jgi:peptidoglycan hydrolase CwlO-like protein